MWQLGDLPKTLPELAALQGLVERSDWHDDDPFQQTMRLYRWLQRLPGSLLESMTGPVGALHGRLVTRPAEGGYTAHELLTFAALIHDVGKAKTYQLQPDGTTRCPGHEAVSARMAPAICARFDLAPQETDLVVRLAAGHGEPYELYKRLAPLTEPEREQRLRRFEEDWGKDLLLLLLLAYGDLVTSHLASRRPQKYAAILAFYQAWFDRLMRQLEENSPRTDP